MTRLLALAAFLVLGGCGAAYISPDVRSSNSDVAIRVVDISAESVEMANRSTTYRPRTLPAIFSQSAGTGSGSYSVTQFPSNPLDAPEQAPTPQLRIPPAAVQRPYEVGIGDVLLLATRRGSSSVEELTGLLAAQNRRQGYVVQDDGAIAIPDVGRIVVEGLTLEAAEAEVFQRLVENQIDPTFSLEVAEFNSQRLAIGGSVVQPTIIPIGFEGPTLEEAIVLAGGLTVNQTDSSAIRIYRDGSLYEIPVSEYLSQRSLQNTRLTDGDSVFVDAGYDIDAASAYFQTQIELASMRQQARVVALSRLQAEVALRRSELQEQRENYLRRVDLGAVERDYVYLTGEVENQSRFPLPFEQTASLADALYESSGIPTQTGNVSQIYVLRASQDPREFGAVTAWRLDGSNAVNITLATRFELRPDDVIFVAEQPITRWNRVVQQIVPSLLQTGARAVSN